MGLVAPRHVGSSQTRARTHVPCIGRQILNHCATREAQICLFLNSSPIVLDYKSEILLDPGPEIMWKDFSKVHHSSVSVIMTMRWSKGTLLCPWLLASFLADDVLVTCWELTPVVWTIPRCEEGWLSLQKGLVLSSYCCVELELMGQEPLPLCSRQWNKCHPTWETSIQDPVESLIRAPKLLGRAPLCSRNYPGYLVEMKIPHLISSLTYWIRHLMEGGKNRNLSLKQARE